jgi:hypothetical protein
VRAGPFALIILSSAREAMAAAIRKKAAPLKIILEEIKC